MSALLLSLALAGAFQPFSDVACTFTAGCGGVMPSSITMAGFTLFGSAAAGGDLTLESTSHGTKGTIFLGAVLTIDDTLGTLITTGAATVGSLVVTAGATIGTTALMTEGAEPAAPAANKALIFAQDNGGGKTQLCVRFPTGVSQCFATEP